MANVREYDRYAPAVRSAHRRRAKRASRLSARPEASPEIPLTAATPSQPNLSLVALLAKRVRINFGDRTLWVSGYNLLENELRNRADDGDEHAKLLLALLSHYGPETDSAGPAQLGASVRTAAERNLVDAFVRRTLETSGVRRPETAAWDSDDSQNGAAHAGRKTGRSLRRKKLKRTEP